MNTHHDHWWARRPAGEEGAGVTRGVEKRRRRSLELAASGTSPRALTASEKLRVIEMAIYSSGDTLTPAEALQLIAAVFNKDPIRRINREFLAELLAFVTPPKARR